MKKGFTLIELLAVIVILAIIALIATPIILGVVENARKSAAGSSALGYIDAVEKEIALGGFDDTIYPTGEVDIVSTRPYNTIDVNGSMPSKGTLNITDNYVVETSVLCINNYKVDVKGHKVIGITKDGCDDMKLKDVTPPVFRGIEDTEVTQWSEFNIMTGVTAIDDYDGDVTENIEYEPNGFTTTQTGEYTVTYKVSDLAGNEVIAERKIIVIPSEYIDNCGATKPNLKGDLIPVTIDDDGTVKKADLNSRWYDYDEKKWANAVLLNDGASVNEDGTISEANIKGYFVWIPKYRYKIWDLGNYTDTTGTAISGRERTIEIEFNLEDTVDSETTCKTPMLSGETGQCAIDKWMTHPAFISFEVDGFWIAKFEVSGTWDNLKFIPNVKPVVGQTVENYFDNLYKYDSSESRVLDSHMTKNTEWGAVAYLSHSKYGINGEIGINNSAKANGYKTGCGAVANSLPTGSCSEWTTASGKLASTTGNITGVYDMSGGAYDYVAAFLTGTSSIQNSYEAKYYDVYTNKTNSQRDYTGRILGDATAELGPMTSSLLSPWYSDRIGFINSQFPYFLRGDTSDYESSEAQAKCGVMAAVTWYNSIAHGSTRMTLAPK